MLYPQALCPGILLKLLSSIERGKNKRAAVNINSGKKGERWKVKSPAKLRRYSINFTLGHPVDTERQTHEHITCGLSHTLAYTQSFTNTSRMHTDTPTFIDSPALSPLSSSDSLALSDTHTLRGSMVGSDTKLMPCHTGCQQISQWITPQPLDVHRAKGHKHGRQRGEGERRGKEKRGEERARQRVRLAAIGHMHGIRHRRG